MPGPATSRELDTIKAIEARKGPVGKGHHNAHRTAALLKWLRAKEAEGKTQGKDSKTPPAKGKNPVPPQFQKGH